MLRSKLELGILYVGMVFPILFILIFPEIYYQYDLADFWTWAQPLKEHIRDIYIQCKLCNYPLLGILLSAGVISRMPVQEFSEIIIPLRLYFSVFDAINVILIYQILKTLEIKHAPFWAGIIGLLPSSWVGSSVFGQIDGIGQSLILFAYLVVIWFNLKYKDTKLYYEIFLLVLGGTLSLMILTKQLLLFSFASIVFMLGINIVLYSQNIFRAIRSFLFVLIAFFIPIVIIDSVLVLKDGYFSHLQYIYDTGSKHGNIVSSNGFNIWTFFVKFSLDSSHIPIDIQVGSLPVISIVPYNAGITIFLLFNFIVASLYLSFFLRNNFITKQRFLTREDIFLFFLHVSLMNLSFNLFLTGARERYLYHFYPFVIIAVLGLFNTKLLYFLFVGAISYGLFVLSHIKGTLPLYEQTPFLIMFAIHFPLYFYLIYLLNRYLKIKT